MMSVAFSASLSVLEQVITMQGVQVQAGGFEELPGVDMGMIFMQIKPALYSQLASMGAIRVLDDTQPWEKDISSVPVPIADWLDDALYI